MKLLFLNSFFVLASNGWSQNLTSKSVIEGVEINNLLQLAKNKNLEESRQWQKLLHIEQNAVGLQSSQIVDPEFFLAQGEWADSTELQATLYALFAAPERFAEQIESPVKKQLHKSAEKILDHSRHAICRFPARLKFLKDNLSEEKEVWSKLPQVQCNFQKIFIEALDAAKISYVFSSYYSDSPGSAFGHTFFRVQRKSN